MEGPETLIATLTLVSPDPSDAATQVRLESAFGTATINDSNVLTATLAGPNTVPEGTPAIFTVKLDGGSSTAPVEIDYGVTGTGVEGTDYEAPSWFSGDRHSGSRWGISRLTRLPISKLVRHWW